MNRIPDGKEIRLPNGDWGIVQGYEEGRYLVIDGYGIGRAKWLAPEQLEPEGQKVPKGMRDGFQRRTLHQAEA